MDEQYILRKRETVEINKTECRKNGANHLSCYNFRGNRKDIKRLLAFIEMNSYEEIEKSSSRALHALKLSTFKNVIYVNIINYCSLKFN